jgi:hypothetical protein
MVNLHHDLLNLSLRTRKKERVEDRDSLSRSAGVITRHAGEHVEVQLQKSRQQHHVEGMAQVSAFSHQVPGIYTKYFVVVNEKFRRHAFIPPPLKNTKSVLLNSHASLKNN